MSESKCFEESQDHLHALKSLLSFLYNTAQAILIFCSSHECPGNDCHGLYGGARAAAEHKGSSVEHQSYKLPSTFLQDGDPQRGR